MGFREELGFNCPKASKELASLEPVRSSVFTSNLAQRQALILPPALRSD